MKKTHKKTAKKVVKKTRAIATKNKDLIWAGATTLLNQSQSKEKQAVLIASEMLNVSTLGVNILGGLPYINKLGRKQKLELYGNRKEKVIYKWLQVAKDDVEKAICQACIIDEKGKELSAWVIGECSPASFRMSTLKGYQNHMAQTRAHNRVIEEHYGVKIHEEFLESLGKRNQKGKAVVMINTSVSAEEINVPNTSKKPEIIQTQEVSDEVGKQDFLLQIKGRLAKLGATSETQAVKILKEKTGVVWKNFDNKREKQCQLVLAQLIQSTLK